MILKKNHQVPSAKGKQDIRRCAEIHWTFDERLLGMCPKPVRSPGIHGDSCSYRKTTGHKASCNRFRNQDFNFEAASIDEPI
jgi:hypothetical protein